MHELEIKSDGTASMFYHGATPWHGLGTKSESLLTASEALTAGGLDWQVEKWQSGARRPDGTYIEAPDSYHLVRATDEAILGRCGSDYNIIQNEDAFTFFDILVGSGEAKYETAGSLKGGRRIWLTARIGDTMQVCGEDHDIFLLLSNGHTGAHALQAATTFVRAVCSNTVTMGFVSAKTTWSLNHKKTLSGAVAEAQETLKMTHKATDAFAKEVEAMMLAQVTKDQFNEMVSAPGFLPAQKLKHAKNVSELVNIFESEPTIVDTDANGTAWGAYNAVTFWLDHVTTNQTPEARMLKLTEGFGRGLRNKTHKQLLVMAK